MKEIPEDMPMPSPRVRRLLESHKSMEVGDSFDLDLKTARCLVSHLRSVGKKAVVRTIGPNLIRVWRFQ